MTTMLLGPERQTPGLPRDLRQLVGERGLIELALDAVQTVGAQLSSPPEPDGRFSGKMMLTLLTYCYAAGSYGSEEIEWACRNDAGARYICANTAPDQETLRCFRRTHRGWVENCLAFLYNKTCIVSPGERRPDISYFVRRKVELAIMIDTAMRD